MWSDPDDIENWAVSPRGAGWLFGGNVVREVGFQDTSQRGKLLNSTSSTMSTT